MPHQDSWIDRTVKTATADSAGLVFVDFDHTLFGGNSTQEYLRGARPLWLVNLFLLAVHAVPWRVLGARWHRIRDYVAVTIVTVASPWNLLRWRRRAAGLFQERINHPLDTALSVVPIERAVIVSFGFDMLISPLVAGTRWAESQRLCTPFLARPSWLRRGKLDLVRNALGPDVVESGTLITDSEDDADLLGQVAHPVLVTPAYGPSGPQEFLYHPMRYTAKAKYVASYVRNQTLLVDLPLLSLATWPHHFSLFYLGAVFAFFFSMAAVYEIGYFENDQVAAKREDNPTLTESARRFVEFPISSHAWPWAMTLGAVGAFLASVDNRTVLSHAWPRLFAAWVLILIVVRTLFFVYNRIQPNQRIFLYPILQAAKVLGPFVVLSGTAVGAAVLLAQVMTMWINYTVYRTGGNQLRLSRDRVRLIAFIVLLSGLLAARPHEELRTSVLQMSIVGLWILILAWKAEIGRTINRFRNRSASA